MFDDNDDNDEMHLQHLQQQVQHLFEDDEIDDKVELDDNDEWFKSSQMKFLKDDVYQLLDESDDNDDSLDVINASQVAQLVSEMFEVNDHNENLEHFISFCLNDNERSWRNCLIFVYQKLKDNVKR